MKRFTNAEKQSLTIAFIVLSLFMIYCGILLSPCFYANDAADFFNLLNQVMENPFKLTWTDKTLGITSMLLLAYFCAFLSVISSLKNRRNGEEHGSAHWGNPRSTCRKFRNKEDCKNLIMTKNFCVDTIDKSKIENLNILIIGGPGSGKTFGHVIPNIFQMNGSFVICDPKGTSAEYTGQMLIDNGYIVKVLDLKTPSRSWGYNPFKYFRDEDDVAKIVTLLFKATTPKGASSQDPFWDNMAEQYILAIALFLFYFAPPEEQNFPTLLDLITYDDVNEDDYNYISPLGQIFMELEEEYPDHIAVQQYKQVHTGAARTVLSIQATAISHLRKYSMSSIRGMSQIDELDLRGLADKKTALFLVIPDNDTSYNFIVSILYVQMFQQLYDRAEEFPKNELPSHVHVFMDEFANTPTTDDFLTIIATCRSRNIGIDVILQNFAQLKGIYKEGWENITGQCSQILYLGGNEQSTHEYISKSLGKETITTNSFNRSRGRNASYTKNEQLSGRELLSLEEVREIDKNKCILFIQGKSPLYDYKMKATMHPNFTLSGYVTEQIYDHGRLNDVAATITKGRASEESRSFELSEKDPGQYNVFFIDDSEISKYFKPVRKES